MGSSNNPPVSRLGLLFHAKEYPALCPEAFPYHLGYCQVRRGLARADQGVGGVGVVGPRVSRV